MLNKIIIKLFGDPSEKKVKEYTSLVNKIKEFEEKFKDFSSEDIKNKTTEFKGLFKELNFKNEEDSKKIIKTLDNIKCEAFALVKTTCKLLNGKEFTLSNGKKITWNMIPYDVQLVGGLSIHEGNISEMKTGEGKTLVATMPAYLNSLTGNSVHIVTVNEYLAERDAAEMGILYDMLGVSTGIIKNEQDNESKKDAYNKDIVYATNNELGFDYLRDNMVIKLESKMQSPLFFAIIDEVDSILIDEARTPLIISAPDNEPTSKYIKFATLAKNLEKGKDYKIDEKQKAATLTETGIQKIENLLKVENIYVSSHYNDLHHIENAIKANGVFKKDKDYLVSNGEVLIIDEHTGRVLSGRRYSDGLHQAIEAKEGVEIQQESKTLASITFQNYFRMYWKLSGMTGTAKTEEEEFYKVYSLDTLVIPTNKPLVRDDKKDLLFKNEKGKFDYVIKLIKELHESGQPILVGTVSVEKSEYLSDRLKKEKVPHEVLNAKHHESEAEVIAKAGNKGAITIATNMAGRGTDIKLEEGVQDLGGLIILGTEKHETRRIDNQLRGRAGRQGDPGMTQFLISPNDDIMRIFGGDKLFSVFNSPMFASLPDEEPLTQSGMLTRKVTGVQKQVEGHNFDARKHLLEYDDVINKHREIIYTRRNNILINENIDEDMKKMISSQIKKLILAEHHMEGEDVNKLEIIKKINNFLGLELIEEKVNSKGKNISLGNKVENDDITGIDNLISMAEYLSKSAIEQLDKIKDEAKDKTEFYELQKKIVLASIDELWMRHIDAMSRLREEVAFEGYAQKQPLVVYKEKAFYKFNDLVDEIEYKSVKAMFGVTKISDVDEVDFSLGDIELNDISIDNILSEFSSQDNQNSSNQINIKNQSNPLFANPNQNKTKIRI